MAELVVASIKDGELVRERRERLVSAATDVFVRKGYHLATVRDIGREAGFTQGTIYNYVRSKADILYLVCDEVVTAYQAAVRRAIDGIVDPAARLSAALRAIVEVMLARQEQILLLYHESHSLDPKAVRALLARVEEFIQTFEEMLAAVRGRRGFAVEHRRLAANIVTFLPTMVALRRWDLTRRVPAAVLVPGLTDFMLRGLGVVGEAAHAPRPRRRSARRHPRSTPPRPRRRQEGSQ